MKPLLFLFSSCVFLSFIGPGELRITSMAEGKSYLCQYAGSDSSGIYAVSLYPGLSAEKMDTNMKVKLSVPIPKFFYDHHQEGLFDTRLMKNHFYVFSMGWSSKTRDYHFLAREIDRTTMKSDTPVDLITHQADYYARNMDNSGIERRFSPHNESFMLFFQASDDKAGNMQYRFKVFDERLQVKWDNVIDLNIPYAKRMDEEAWVSDNGDVYMIAKQFTGKDSVPDLYFYSVTQQGKKTMKLKIAIEGESALAASVGTGKDGQVYLCGTYTKPNGKAVEGIFYSSFNTGKNEEPTLVYTSATSDFHQRYNQDDGNFFQVRSINPATDGGAFMLLERRFVREKTNIETSPGSVTFENINLLYYTDVIVYRFAANGDPLYESIVEKHQVSRGSPMDNMSFCSVVTGNRVFLLYDDDMVDAKIPLAALDGEPYHFTSFWGVFKLAEIDSSGHSAIQTMEPELPKGALLEIDDVLQANDRELLFYYGTEKVMKGNYRGRIVFPGS